MNPEQSLNRLHYYHGDMQPTVKPQPESKRSMYSELRPTLMASAREALKQTRERMPKASFQAIWNQCKKDDSKLFGDLQAADYEEEDKAEEREREETHGAFQPSAPSTHQFSLAEHMALFAKLQGPKQVEATQQEGFICVGGFFNPV
jgi:hypothetical protein